jgi:hypothetical protein
VSNAFKSELNKEMIMRTAILTICVLGALIIGCNKGSGNPTAYAGTLPAVAAEDQGVISAEKMDQLLSEDFSEAIVQCSPSQEEADRRASLSTDPKDKILLDALITPSGKKRELSEAVAGVVRFAMEHGRLPENGLELFPELLTVAGYDAFMRLSPVQRFEKYSAGVNLVTGKFYSTYSGDWNPGGLSFAKAEQGKTVVLKTRPNGKPLLSTKSPSGYDDLWHYQAYGATKGKIIYTDWIGLKMGDHQNTNPEPIESHSH